jgi:hypothetical protein
MRGRPFAAALVLEVLLGHLGRMSVMKADFFAAAERDAAGR